MQQLKGEKLHQKITASAQGISIRRAKAKSYTLLETKTWNSREKPSKNKKKKKPSDLAIVMHINERNLRFNRKVNAFYDKFTQQRAEAVERGTAM